MADTEKKQVIIDVKVERDKQIQALLNEMGEIQKTSVNLSETIDQLHRLYKAGKVDVGLYSKVLVQLTEQRKTAINQLRSLSREEQNLVVANTAAKGSVAALRAEYNALSAEWLRLPIGSERFVEVEKQMIAINETLSKTEQRVGKFGRNVGNYASGFSAVGFQVQQIARELPTLAVGLPQFFLALSNNIPMLTDAIRQEQAAVEAAKKAGEEHMSVGKQLVKSIFSWQTAMVAAISVLTIWGDDIFKWIGSLFKGKDALDDFRKSASEMVGAVAQERAELAALFNALAMAEQGTANYAAVRNTILDKYGDLLENEREEVKNLNDIATAYDVIAKKITGKAIMEGFSKQLEDQSKEFGEAYQKYYEKLLPDFQKYLGDDAQSSLIAFINATMEGNRKAAYEAIKGNDSLQAILGGSISTDFYQTDRNSTIRKMEKEFGALNDQILATTEAQQTLLKEFGAEVPDTKNDGKGGEDDEYNRAKRSLESQQKLEAEKLKSQEQYQYNAYLSAEENDALEFAHQQEHARKVFELEQQHKEQMLKLDEQYGKISAEDAKATRELYAQERTTFLNEQAAETSEYLRKQSEEMLKEADKLRKQVTKANEQTEIEATTKKWADYRTSLANNTAISETERADLTALSLEAEEAEKLAIKRKYKEAERRVQKEKERELREEYADRLALEWENADAQYDITRQMLEEQLKLYEENSAERAKIEQQLAENEKQRTLAKLDYWMEYANEVTNLLSSVSQMANSIYAGQLETEKATNEKALADLEKRHKAGLIKERDYNRQREQLEKDYAKKEAQIKRKQAIMERGLAVFNIGIKTAEGVIRALAENAANPVRGGILAGLMTAASAAQIAAVLAEPLPMARQGGLIQGATHEQGGVLVNTEDKERIISAKPAQAFPELLNLISYIGKHAHIPQSGYAFRGVADNAATAQAIGQQVQKAVKAESAAQAEMIGQQVGKVVAKELENLEVVTYVEAFKKREKEYNKVVNSAKL